MSDFERLVDVANENVEIITPPRRLQVVNTTGICIDCEAAISPQRLSVLPTAQRCIFCQHDAESYTLQGT